MVSFIQPLDLEQLFVNVFSGNFEIFFFVAFIAIAALAARFRMPNVIALLMFGLFGVFMANWFSGLYFLVVLVAGIATFYGVGSLIKR